MLLTLLSVCGKLFTVCVRRFLKYTGSELFTTSNAELDIDQIIIVRTALANSAKSDHGCTSRIYFDNAGDNVALTLYNVTLTSQ